jgi:hypothetical protein
LLQVGTGAFLLDAAQHTSSYLTYQGLDAGGAKSIALYNFGRGKNGARIATLCGLSVGLQLMRRTHPDLVFPDHSLSRDQALAQINETIRQASARLKTRGFQVRAVTATDHPKFALRQKTCIR